MSLAPPETVRKLQVALHAQAKGAPGYRFYAPDDKVYRRDVLEFAFDRCRSHDGAPGSTARRARTSRRTASRAGWTNWPRTWGRRRTTRNPCGGSPSPNRMASDDRRGSGRFAIAWRG